MMHLTPSPLPYSRAALRGTMGARHARDHRRRERSTQERGEAMSMQTTIVRRSETESLQFRLLYAFCFGIFLIAAAVKSLLPWHWFKKVEGMTRHSIFAQARSAAAICAGYVFMV